MLGLNRAEALTILGKKGEAIDQAQRTLRQLDCRSSDDFATIEGIHFPASFDHFRVEWERAAWQNVGDPGQEFQAKLTLLRWRLYAVLGMLARQLPHFYESVLARPDLPTSRSELGIALFRAKRYLESIPHLRLALEGNPFDRDAARALYESLGKLNDREAQNRLAHDRRLLVRAAPSIVRQEEWFIEESTDADITESSARPLDIIWEGPQLLVYSLAHVNREICQRLIKRGHELSLLPSSPKEGSEVDRKLHDSLIQCFHKPLARPADIHIRHGWPPLLSPPSSGLWIMMQPWEYGSLPRVWIKPYGELADEVWVPSRFVRDCYLESGIPAEHIYVIPLGVDPNRFHPDVAPLALQTKRKFKFLFVGGTLHRKGIDLLLEAYNQTFSDQDDVCLVIKDLGAGAFYKGQTAEKQIAESQSQPDGPEIEYIRRELTDAELVGLYTASDCLVHPYRGEGFGLPIAEAMACGLPVIVTGAGAALDFCNQQNAFLIPARKMFFRKKQIGELETVGYPWLMEPDLQELARLLRHVVDNPADRRSRADAGREHIRAHFTWDHTVDSIESRLNELRGRTPRRLSRSTLVSGEVITNPFITTSTVSPTAPALSQPNRPSAKATPHSPLVNRDTPLRTRVSLCMIVKNEADKLADCLQSVADLVDEMIVVDTGSTDATRQIAADLGAKVILFDWVDDFSAARNESLRHATGEWAFWLDADERLDESNRVKLKTVITGLQEEKIAYVMRQVSVAADGSGSAMSVDQVRLFRRDTGARWQYRVHEQILLSLRQLGHDVRFTDIAISHIGYQDEQFSDKKLERNLRLLHVQDADQPNDPITLYHLGLAYGQQGRTTEALAHLRRSLELAPPDYSIRPKLFTMLGRGHHRLQQRAEALAICRTGLQNFPDDVELLFLQGLLLHEENDYAAAAVSLERLLTTRPQGRFTALDAGLRTYKARNLLGEVYHALARYDEAETAWRTVIAEQPQFQPAWLLLGDLIVKQSRWADLDQLTTAPSAHHPIESDFLRARGYIAQKKLTEAQSLLERVVNHSPKLLKAWLLLSRTLLQQGENLPAAEKALSEVLSLAPDHREATENLQRLRQHRTMK